VGVVPERVVCPAKEELEVGDFLGCGVDYHGVRRDIAQPLIFLGNQTTDAPDRVKGRQQIHDSQQVPNYDLRRTQPESFCIHYADFECPFSGSLTSPDPFEKDGISDGDDKIGDCSRAQGNVRADNGGKQKDLGKDPRNNGNSGQVDRKGKESGHRAGKVLRKTNAFRGEDDERVGTHWEILAI